MPRFTLRDLFWLTLVVGMALGWWLHSRRQAVEIQRLTYRETVASDRLKQLEMFMLEEGYTIGWEPWPNHALLSFSKPEKPEAKK